MWFVKSENQSRAFYFIQDGENIVIGRKLDPETCNFAISDDSSISRKHATIFVKEGNLFVQDLESRYGTFINDSIESKESIKHGDMITLHENDRIKFGKLGSLWRVHKINFVTCTSTLKGENLQALKTTITKLGGMLKSDWDSTCCYLTMPAITLTIKVVLALVQNSHIVTPEYWNKCLEAITNQVYLPNPKDYVPQVVESTLNKEVVSFLPNIRRRTLFNGKRIIFFSKRQMDMYKGILLASSASVLLMSESQMTKANLCEDNVIVIQYLVNGTTQESQVQQTKLNDIVNYLKSMGRRVIPDAEIGLGILFCSLEKYCNPQFSFSSEVLRKSTPSVGNKASDVLAMETQDFTEKVSTTPKVERVIEETFICSKDMESDTASLKRKLSDENGTEITNMSKKQDTGNNKSIDVEEGDIFNFVQQDNVTLNSNSDTNRTEKKLSFLKPQKRKADNDDQDNDLFDFLPDQNERSATNTSLNATLTSRADEINSDEDSLPQSKRLRLCTEDIKPNISDLRGKKLEEIKYNPLAWKSCADVVATITIKEEDIGGDLESKMSGLDIGTTVVTIRKYKPVERDTSFTVGNQNMDGSKVQNFKKFKKIWPIRMQITLIPESFPNINNGDRDQINAF